MRCASSLRRCARTVALLVASTLLAGAPALAQDAPSPEPDPRLVALRCVEGIHEIAHQARARIADTTVRTVRFIGYLESQGAPDPLLARAGAEGRGRLLAIGEDAPDLINARTHGCLRLLRELEANPGLAKAVLEARKRSLETISLAIQRGLGAIRQALGLAPSPGQDALIDGTPDARASFTG